MACLYITDSTTTLSLTQRCINPLSWSEFQVRTRLCSDSLLNNLLWLALPLSKYCLTYLATVQFFLLSKQVFKRPVLMKSHTLCNASYVPSGCQSPFQGMHMVDNHKKVTMSSVPPMACCKCVQNEVTLFRVLNIIHGATRDCGYASFCNTRTPFLQHETHAYRCKNFRRGISALMCSDQT